MQEFGGNNPENGKERGGEKGKRFLFYFILLKKSCKLTIIHTHTQKSHLVEPP